MKKLLMLVIILLLAAGIALYLFPQTREILPDAVRAPVSQVLPPNETAVYKWKDAAGNWQYTDTPPEGDIPYTVVRVPNDANVMPAEAVTGQ